jgi:hypothetical protein
MNLFPPDNVATKDDIRGLIPKLDLILALLHKITSQENTMAIDLTKLTAEVAANTSVTTSVETLISNLAAQIAAIPTSTDPATQAALDALVQQLNANDTGLAAAVTANTPVTPAAAAKSA